MSVMNLLPTLRTHYPLCHCPLPPTWSWSAISSGIFHILVWHISWHEKMANVAPESVEDYLVIGKFSTKSGIKFEIFSHFSLAATIIFCFDCKGLHTNKLRDRSLFIFTKWWEVSWNSQLKFFLVLTYKLNAILLYPQWATPRQNNYLLLTTANVVEVQNSPKIVTVADDIPYCFDFLILWKT